VECEVLDKFFYRKGAKHAKEIAESLCVNFATFAPLRFNLAEPNASDNKIRF
jgi:hypothetical protein